MWYVYKLKDRSLVSIYPLKSIAKEKMKCLFEWESSYVKVRIPEQDLGLLKFSSTEHFYTWVALQKRY